MENQIICKCKKVSVNDIEKALHTQEKFTDAVKAFDSVQEITHCSTGCGGCHDKVLDVIADFLSK